MSVIDVVAGLLVLVGLVGIVVPVIPGLFIVWVGVVLWVFETQTTASWWVLGVATVLWVGGMVLQYAVPGRRMRRAGVRTSTLVLGVIVGIVFAVLIPVVGFLLGFPLGIYLVERSRRGGHAQAWAALTQALRAVATTIGIELLTAVAIIGVWALAVWRG